MAFGCLGIVWSPYRHKDRKYKINLSQEILAIDKRTDLQSSLKQSQNVLNLICLQKHSNKPLVYNGGIKRTRINNSNGKKNFGNLVEHNL